MTDTAVSKAEQESFSTVPLRWTNFPAAMNIAIRSFGTESLVIALCYLWHLLSQLGIRLDRLLLHRRAFTLHLAEREVGTLEVLTSPLYGGDVCWVRLSYEAGTDTARLIATLKSVAVKYRLVVLRLERADPLPTNWPELQAHGTLGDFVIYSYRSSKNSPDTSGEPLKKQSVSAQGNVSADFVLVERNGQAIGLTGSYAVDFWPGIAWGGWGALIKSAGFRDAGLETVRLTESLAARYGASQFCIETSDGVKYRAARKIYQIYGLNLLLEIPHFYRDGEAFLVFGKTLVKSGDPTHG